MENQIHISTFGPFNLGDLTVESNSSLFGKTNLNSENPEKDKDEDKEKS